MCWHLDDILAFNWAIVRQLQTSVKYDINVIIVLASSLGVSNLFRSRATLQVSA